MPQETITEILTQLAEEAAFLWLLREAAVRAPHYSLADLGKLDNRVEAHIDGLRISGDDGWEVLKKQLEKNAEPGESRHEMGKAILRRPVRPDPSNKPGRCPRGPCRSD